MTVAAGIGAIVIASAGIFRPADLFEFDGVTLLVVLDAAHEISHEHDAAAIGAANVLLIGTVWNRFGIEALALVADLDPDLIVRRVTNHVDLLVAIQAISVLDGVDDGLFQGESNAKHLAGVPILSLEARQQVIEYLMPLAQIAGDGTLVSPGWKNVGHD